MAEVTPVTRIFQDAWSLQTEAMEELRRGKIRDAAEKAWGATKRATDALILARTGDGVRGRIVPGPPEEPRTTGRTNRELRRLGRLDPLVQHLVGPYFTRAGFLHGQCFYDGMCDPVEAVEDDIRGTADYIRVAQELAVVV